MNSLKCLIVEDEPLAAEILEDYINQLPYLELIGICKDALFAMEKLHTQKVDLMFLDIHLPKLKGLDFLKTLKDPPRVIITSAYHQYALEGFELNVVDYLLKPIEFSRFLKAVNKVYQNRNAELYTSAPQKERIAHFFNVNKKNVRIYEEDILYIESLKEYVRIVTPEQKWVTKMQLGEIVKLLSPESFIRTHRSFVIAIDKIEAYTGTTVEISNYTIPIGRSYRSIVIELLESL